MRFLWPSLPSIGLGFAPSGLGFLQQHFPRRCLGLSTLRPFGAPSHRKLPTGNSEEMRFLAVSSGSMVAGPKAPKGRDSIAQGTALGIGMKKILSPERATPAGGFALSGLGVLREFFPGRCPGLSTFRPFGAPNRQQLPLKIAGNQKSGLTMVESLSD